MNRASLSSEPAGLRRSAFTGPAKCGKEVDGCHAHGFAWAWAFTTCPRKAVGMAPEYARPPHFRGFACPAFCPS
jgi:hypothetical protein